MNDIEFGAKVFEINRDKLDGKIGPLTAGAMYRQLCEEWLLTHDSLPQGFEGFAEKNDGG